MCAVDPLFWCNTFCWVAEPRQTAILPAITAEYQDELFLHILRNIKTGEDLVIPKSRDMRVTWSILTCYLWLWEFWLNSSFLCMSKNESFVDKRGDPKTLFWKLDFLLNNQPEWLRPKGYDPNKHRACNHMENPELGCTIDGESTNKFAGVADRRLSIMLDEFSKMDEQSVIFTGTRDVADCRIFPFTPQGAGNESYKIAHNPDIDCHPVHWSQHPTKAIGLYQVSAEGEVTYLDQTYWTPQKIKKEKVVKQRPKSPHYDFRSPWYDTQCKRTNSDSQIAQELDLDFLGSESPFFNHTTLDELQREFVIPPLAVGNFFPSERPFTYDPEGKLKLWFPPTVNGPPKGTYVVGVDIAMGTGASNSCISVVNIHTGEKVAEYVDHRIYPEKLAELAVSICEWFYHAKLIWEKDGPGSMFGRRIIQLQYSNLYLSRNEQVLTVRMSDMPGWKSTAEEKKSMLSEYRRAWTSKEFINRSAESYEEARRFVIGADSVPHYSGINKETDPAKARKNHGDRVIADGLACLLLIKPGPMNLVPRQEEEPYGSLVYFRKQRERERLEAELV